MNTFFNRSNLSAFDQGSTLHRATSTASGVDLLLLNTIDSTVNPAHSLPTHSLVVIDASVQNYASLATGVLPGETVIILDSQRNGLTQITEALAQRRNVSSLHLVTHGGSGYMQLGNLQVDSNTLANYGSEIGCWTSAFTPNADILLYGCDVATGDQGLQFVQQLSHLTQTDVAASNDRTGSWSARGDWELETAIGAIEAPIAFQPWAIDAYQGTLGTTYLSDLTWASATNGWGTIEKDKSNGDAATGDGSTLTLNGLTYSKGLGVHANSEINYSLGGRYSSFTSDIGVDDEVGSNGSLIFQVWADGTRLYDSGVMTGSSPTKRLNVDVTGKQSLKLVVSGGSDGIGYDHANWADAKLLSGAGTPPPSGQDTTAPTAALTAATLSTPSSNPYAFTVTYSDSTAVNASTISNSDVRVTGANNFSQLARLLSVSPTGNSTPLAATYQITAPDGIWNWNDKGTYTATLVAGEVGDTLGNKHLTDVQLGTFQVAVQSTIALGTSSLTVTEGGSATIRVNRLGDTTGTASVQYFTGGNSTATANSDYRPLSGILLFEPGDEFKEVSVQTLDDTAAEGNETVSLLIDRTEGADLGTSRTSLITIVDNDAAPPPPPASGGTTYLSNLAWASATNGWGTVEKDKSNGDAASGDGSTLTLNGLTYSKGLGVHANSEINYSLGGRYSSFTSDIGVDDEVGSNGSLIFQVWADGTRLYDSGVMTGSSPTKRLNVDVTGKQSLKLVVSGGSDGIGYDHANWADAKLLSGAGTSPPSGFSLVSNSVPVNETAGSVSFTVQRSSTAGTASVNYATANGTATAGSDYTAVAGTLTFAAGESRKTVTVPIANDTTPERSETLTLQLSNPVGATLSSPNSATATIADNDIGSFTRERFVGGLTQPTAFDWSSDGRRMYVAQKNGIVRVVDNGSLLPQPFIDISAQVNENHDRGLLGIAVHPRLLSGQPYIYLLFTYDPPETNPSHPLNNPNSLLDNPDQSGNRPSRLIRVEADAATNYTTVKPNTAVVLLGNNSNWQYTSRPDGNSTDNFSILPSGIVNGSTITAPSSLIDGNGNIRDYLATDSESHSIGSVHFGLDGMLYVSVGDGTSYNAVDRRAVRVQDIDNLSGKLLRIDPITGKGVSTNPFFNGNADSNRSKVWSYGFRNPFRFTIQPGTGTPYVGDVGWSTWEEVNKVTKGGNFGWPYYEGGNGASLRNSGYSALPQAQAFYNSGQSVVDPVFARNHNPDLNADGKGAAAIVMGDFYSGTTFPTAYNGALFFTDANLGTVYSMFLEPDGTVNSIKQFDSVPYIVDIETGADGNLYYVDLYGGEIGRWRPN